MEKFYKCGIRLRVHTAEKANEVQIGRDGDIVFSVHFRNDGTNSIVRVGKDGVFVRLRPGEEKEFGVTPPYSMEETFLLAYDFENQSSWRADGTRTQTDEEALAAMVQRCTYGEIFLKKSNTK